MKRPATIIGSVGAVLLLTAAAGCNGGSNDDDNPDAAVVRPPDASEAWSHEVVDDGNVGMFTQMVIADDGPAMAYFGSWGRNDGPCEELVTDPPTRVLWDLYYAQRTGAEAWSVESVAEILMVGLPPGLDLDVTPGGTPVLSTVTGDPVVEVRYCGGNDVGYYQRTSPGTWSVTAAVRNSNEAATGQPASDYGYVVGFWPGLAFDGSGNALIAYRDVHAGGMQVDDNLRSDLELAWQSGGDWQAIPVDIGKGAGMYSTMIFDGQGRPNIVYTNQEPVSNGGDQGILVARSDDEGATWEFVKLFPGSSFNGPSVAVGADDVLRVAYYHPTQGIPYLATLDDDASFPSLTDGWTQTALGDPRYDEGYDPSIAVDADGRVAMAYYRCTRATQGIGNCAAADDGLVFAFLEFGDWTYELVDPGEDYGQCGRYPTLAFDADGNAVIGYTCQTMVGEDIQDEVRFAYREPF